MNSSQMKTVLSWMILMLFLFISAGCGLKMTSLEKARTAGGSPKAAYEPDAEAASMYDRAEYSFKESAPAPAPVMASRAKKASPAKAKEPSKKRMVYYNGYAKLRTTTPSELIEKARDIVTSSGGYVESIREGNATFRVPVKDFQTIFRKILTLGDVLAKDITASDITDAYSDNQLKLKVARDARLRYLELLRQATDEEEKLQILKEIARLNEEIERLENIGKTLSSLADFSRITIDVVPRMTLSNQTDKPDIFEFKWIHDLSPFSGKNAHEGKTLTFEVPKDMVVIDKIYWTAESADGVVFKAYKRDNEPKGDADFWIKSIKNRIEKEFSKAEVKTIGKYSFIRLVSFSDKPYVYWVGVSTDDKTLRVIEVYYPTQDHETRFSKLISDSIEKDAK